MMTPSPKKRVIMWDPYLEPEYRDVEFRLTYAGKLLSTRSNREDHVKRTPHKHDLRKEFHKQLKLLWQTHPTLVGLSSQKMDSGKSFLEDTADYYATYGFRWVPLVTRSMSLFCKLEILMLRPGDPGNVRSDLDNRLKTLFDALTMPPERMEGILPTSDENPFFVLLQDDRLITHIVVESDTLLQSIDGDENDVRLTITVTARPYRVGIGNIDFAS